MRRGRHILVPAPAGAAPAGSHRAGLTLLLVLAVLLLAGGARAEDAASPDDHVLERAVFRDDTGTLGIADMDEAPFAPSGEIITGGYTGATTWVRLGLRRADPGIDLVLRIRPSYLDTVRLYVPDPGRPGGWTESVSGDLMPLSARPLRAVTLGFPLPRLEADTTVYLALSTTTTSLMHIEAVHAASAQGHDLMLQVIHAVILGFVIWILFWSINEYFTRRDALMALFALNQFAYVCYGLLVTGYAALLFPAAPPGFLSAATNLIVCWTPLICFVTFRSLVRAFEPHRLALMAYDALIFIDLTAIVLLMLGMVRPALQLNALAIGSAVVLIPFGVFTARREALPGRRILRIVFVLQALFLTLTMAPLLGLVPGTRWNLDALPIHGLVSGTLMFFLLHQRSRQLVKAGLEAELDLAFTRRELELERGQRDLQNRFVAMLTHELKTPLSVVRITLDTMRAAGEPRRLIDCALDNMNAIIERCNYADLLDRQQLEQSREPCDLSAVLAEAVARSPAPERVSVSAERVPRVHADRLLLGVLLGNLIDNALKYSPEGAPVDIRIARGWQAGRPVVTVAISNPPGRAGLPDPERVFAKFYRSPGAHSSSGSGLGLYIVRGIAELLGGQIVYRAKEGEAEFSLWLPC